MTDGVIGLYKNKTGIIYFNLRPGDDGLPFEEILPPEIRGDNFDDALISAFINIAYLWFSSSKQWETWWAKRDLKPGQTSKAKLPPLDLKELNVLRENGEIDYLRVKDLFALIHPCWAMKPAIGLIAELVARDHSYDEMSELLAIYAKYGGNLPDLDRCFMELFVRPENSRKGLRINREDIEYGLKWCRRPDGSGSLEQDNFIWELNFRELGIVNSKGLIDQIMAQKVRNFIWRDPDRTPDYFALRKYLLPVPNAKTPSGQMPKAYRDKLKKRRREAGEMKRKGR